MEPLIGEIRLFGGKFAPKKWLFCDGQLLPIAQNQALFSILGTTYGGDGSTTFALPDLRGRVPIHAGSGHGLSTRKVGQKSGTETNSLTISQLPTHNHPTKIGNIFSLPVNIEISSVSTVVANDAFSAIHEKDGYAYSSDNKTKTETQDIEPIVEVGNIGNSFPINNMQPFAVINYIIALDGIIPEEG